MCKAFEKMVDKTEAMYGCHVIAVCCDNDGRSQSGRKQLIVKQLWLFDPPCCAHQLQLILGDYFKVSKEAIAIAEEATEIINWVNHYRKVKIVFDEVQCELTSVIVVIKPPIRIHFPAVVIQNVDTDARSRKDMSFKVHLQTAPFSTKIVLYPA